MNHPPRILVLGGTGFVGRQVCEQLARLGLPVTVPTRRATQAASIQNLPGLTVVEASVHSTHDLPLRELLSSQGIDIKSEAGSLAQRLGLRVNENSGHVHVKSVLRHSAAEAAGLAAGDEWLGLDVGNKGQGGSWRLNKLEELSALLGQERQFIALVARDKRLLRLPMKMPEESSTWKLATAEGRQSGWPAA